MVYFVRVETLADSGGLAGNRGMTPAESTGFGCICQLITILRTPMPVITALVET